MARRNHLRSVLAAALLMVGSGAAGMLAAPSPAGAHHNPNFKPDHIVTVYKDYFDPAVVYATRGQTVQFNLAPGESNHHTVTLDNGKCTDLPESLCEKTFDDPGHPPVYRFGDYGEYGYYDRYAREAGCDMRGKIVVTDDRPTVQPTNPPPTTSSCAMTSTSSSSTSSSTTTTRPATTTTLPPTTTTTAPTPIRPFLIGNTGPTATTVAPPPAGPAAATTKKGGAASAGNKNKGKGDGKGKADTPATAQPATPEGTPIEVTFDPAMLTPLPDTSVTATGDTTPESGAEESAMLDLLSADAAVEDRTRLLLIGSVVLGFLVLLTGAVAWFRRGSRYFPA